MSYADEVLTAIEEHVAERGVTPTYAELLKRLGLTSNAMLRKAIVELQRQGHIAVPMGMARSMVLTTPTEKFIRKLRLALQDMRNGHSVNAVARKRRLPQKMMAAISSFLVNHQ